jgi:tryptophan-rich sensory protein
LKTHHVIFIIWTVVFVMWAVRQIANYNKDKEKRR